MARFNLFSLLAHQQRRGFTGTNTAMPKLPLTAVPRHDTIKSFIMTGTPKAHLVPTVRAIRNADRLLKGTTTSRIKFDTITPISPPIRVYCVVFVDGTTKAERDGAVCKIRAAINAQLGGEERRRQGTDVLSAAAKKMLEKGETVTLWEIPENWIAFWGMVGEIGEIEYVEEGVVVDGPGPGEDEDEVD